MIEITVDGKTRRVHAPEDTKEYHFRDSLNRLFAKFPKLSYFSIAQAADAMDVTWETAKKYLEHAYGLQLVKRRMAEPYDEFTVGCTVEGELYCLSEDFESSAAATVYHAVKEGLSLLRPPGQVIAYLASLRARATHDCGFRLENLPVPPPGLPIPCPNCSTLPLFVVWAKVEVYSALSG